MKERLCFVQFLHPGGEHVPDGPEIKHWNRGDHRRKFMRVRGRFLDPNEHVRGEELVFWGEWEPDSRVVATIDDATRGCPQFVYEPFLGEVPSGWRQNTDPFVFGTFHYTGCLQHTKRGPTQLRFLEHGSVILFGSCVDRTRFVLDTVFVIARHIDHCRTDYRRVLKGQISPVYESATIDPWYSGPVPEGRSHRLYFGATYEAQVEGMFSFFPCLPSENASIAFARPEISLPEVITPTLNQGKRLNPQEDRTAVRPLWSKVVEQVRDQGMMLGIHAEVSAS